MKPTLRNRIIRQLLASHRSRLALAFLLGMGIMAIFADFLANERPLMVIQDEKVQFPVVEGPFYGVNWEKQTFEFAIWPLVRYGNESDAGSVSPHLLGKDRLGRDLLASLIHGSRISLTVGLGTMFIALLIGIIIGGAGGYWGNKGVLIAWPRLAAWLMGIFLVFYYGYFIRKGLWGVPDHSEVRILLFHVTAILIICDWIGRRLARIWPGTYALPLDSISHRLVELIDALPVLLIVIALSAIFAKKLGGDNESGTPLIPLIVILGGLSWTGIARLVRAEVVRIKELDYISAARGLGFSQWRILFRHIFPNGLVSLWVVGAFGIGRAILAESTLSFLGMGPANSVSWGKLLYISSVEDIRHVSFLVFFLPCLMIFLTVLSCNALGAKIKDIIDPTP